MAEDVIAFKTVSNEEVVAGLVERNEDHLILSKPRALVMQQSPDGSVSLGMLPFMASASDPELKFESNVKIYLKDIMAEPVTTPKALADAYLKTVSTIALI